MKLRVTVNSIDYDVEVDILEEGGSANHAPAPAAPAPPAPVKAPAPSASGGGKSLTSPIPGTVVEIKVQAGQAVAAGETVMIIDAMKMNTPIAANAAGTVKQIFVAVSDAVKMGQPLVEFD